ncbi:MAG: Flp pilus assembly complex ATPase component TadA [Actinomycetota bacterium]|nr:Flp pilus assembly complex ATPase component TadA [Actinomycetota bacterium]
MTERSVGIVEEEVRQLVRLRGIDPAREGQTRVSKLIDEVLTDYEIRTESSNLPRFSDRSAVQKAVYDRVAGLGPLQPFMDDPQVEEIWINGPGKVFCARAGSHVLTNVVLSEPDIADLVERMLRNSGRRLDLSSPFVDATLVDGSRLHVAIPDVTRKHWAVNIRKFVLRAHHLSELIRLGSLDERPAAFLEAAVIAGLNIVVCGGTQTGKTTMLNCLATAIPGRERAITCEEVFELQVRLPDVVSLQTRQANLEGRGAIDLRRLITEALRMRPDRIIVGEVRGQEALDLLVALNSGLPGMTSVHANSAYEALTKLTTLPLLAGENVSHGFVVPTVASSVDLLVHLTNDSKGRKTGHILGVTGRVEGDRIETVSLFAQSGGALRWTGHQPPATGRFRDAGIDLQELLA